ncbi:pyridoxamine 5'-phosphate oxidase-like FMN- binding protein [Halosimplex carlsbadense 2-9-1]|uniref:Pyridoxamine 5'-phosphate oxidase-like FMN-binding protein n=1 Tax=Halosimplex carlsbadense 2-9-1 TaxID=797114 RepID=M0CBB9_9EURY|nr:pyridoxamine 5'-phosphate oxidase family protein [Halosimplex carlsbadense]ELZ19933.1 pyridoxamine 5'-phosphate oxidase-like FMN- binding protein [Halosimplex carlsbadense 2-9-1]
MTVDDLTEHGAERMDDEAIASFLSSQRVGVLGLPGEEGGAPAMRPLSFAFDDPDGLYLLYVGGGESRKRDLSDRAESARFLVYSAETAFNWRSVLLTGSIERVSPSTAETLGEETHLPWQPDLLGAVGERGDTSLYRFAIDERAGLRHAGLPEGFDVQAGDGGS